jgi:hypothetical protein
MPPLSTLYARFDAIANGSEKGDSSAAHGAILDRLAANRLTATTEGWTSLRLERDGGGGRLRLVGLPPSGSYRTAVPDSGAPAKWPLE